MVEAKKLQLASADLLGERIDALRELFPEIFTEDKIDYDRLKLALGEHVADGPERYGLTWPGKADAIKAIQTPSTGTLVPMPDKSVNFDTSGNLIIEGDNLEVLKLLQKSYHGKVKMIYIDPPYNTGNEYIYPDNYREGLTEYLRWTDQIQSNGARFSSNTETSGRYHSTWLSMMYPRLFLARNLLHHQGVIFVSIDDHEVHNLRLMMDEIFGYENFVASIAWEKRYTRSNNAKLFYSLKDTILVFRRSEELQFMREPRTEKSDSNYSNPDNDPRGDWMSASYVNPATKQERPNLVYTIVNPNTNEPVNHPTHAWKYGPSEHRRHVAEGRLWWGRDGSAKYPRLKIYLAENTDGLVPVDVWDYKATGTTDEGGTQLKDLFDGVEVFDNPKPVRLVRRMLQLVTQPQSDDIVLDFFAGSGTTGHAVTELNREDQGNRKYILVQLPEPADVAGYESIADICRERMRRAIASSWSGSDSSSDGFRAFELVSSNFRLWDGSEGSTSSEMLTRQLELHVEHVLPDRSQQDILFELVLKAGLHLAVQIQPVADGTAYLVEGDALLLCLELQITEEMLDAIIELEPVQVICLDSAFQGNDQLKTNAVLEMKSHDIEFRTV